MRFTKISVTKKGVDLTRETKNAIGAVEEVHLNSPERPLASFTDALAAFAPYVEGLFAGAIVVTAGVPLTITTLNLSEDKNGLRGLIVTATVPVPKAYDKPLVLNTPLVREGGENASDDACVLTDEVLQLIALVEAEALRYVKGERLGQGDLFAKAVEKSPAAESFNERAAAAEVASTRKPRQRKGKDFIPGVGDVANPEATRPPVDDTLRQLLAQAGQDVPVDAIARWTSTQRDAAQRWASAACRAHSGDLAADAVPRIPKHVEAAASAPLM